MWTGIMLQGFVVGHTGATRAPADIFDEIYTAFLVLGTLVGIVVIGYTLYNVYKYREDGTDSGSEAAPEKVDRPALGEIPQGSGGGKKLFVSFFFSAIIVLSLIVWTYSALLYVENEGQNADMDIDVVGQKFSWTFVYPNGHKSTTLRVPVNDSVRLHVTSKDVMHNIGIPEFNAKTDAIPGRTNTAWFLPKKTGDFEAICYELCGQGHSQMRSDVIVMEQDAYERWYANTTSGWGMAENTTADTATTEGES